MRRRIHELWQLYEREVIPAGMGETARTCTRLAFFAGAGVLFGEIIHSLSPGDEATDSDFDTLDEIAAELKQHIDDNAREGGVQ